MFVGLLLFLQVKHFLMKKIFSIILSLAVIALVFTSCERRCICKYLDDGTQETIYNAYSKSECNDWEKYLNDDLHMNADCNYKTIK